MKTRKPSKIKLLKRKKTHSVMHRWKAGKLKSKYGNIVRYPEERSMAIALALNEANKLKNKR